MRKMPLMFDRKRIHLKPIDFPQYRELRDKLQKENSRAYASINMLYAEIASPDCDFESFDELCDCVASDNLIFRFSIPHLSGGWDRYHRPFDIARIATHANERGVLFVHTAAGRDTHQLCFERNETRVLPIELSAPVAALPCYAWHGRAPRELYIHALANLDRLMLRPR